MRNYQKARRALHTDGDARYAAPQTADRNVDLLSQERDAVTWSSAVEALQLLGDGSSPSVCEQDIFRFPEARTKTYCLAL